eukprot:15668688-Heterocapsa_arctica.AAC.1
MFAQGGSGLDSSLQRQAGQLSGLTSDTCAKARKAVPSTAEEQRAGRRLGPALDVNDGSWTMVGPS